MKIYKFAFGIDIKLYGNILDINVDQGLPCLNREAAI